MEGATAAEMRLYFEWRNQRTKDAIQNKAKVSLTNTDTWFSIKNKSNQEVKTMELELAEKLVEMLQEEGYDAELRECYMGRWSFNRHTAGVVCDSLGDLLAMVISRADEFVDNEGESIFDVSTKIHLDSMGLSKIIY